MSFDIRIKVTNETGHSIFPAYNPVSCATIPNAVYSTPAADVTPWDEIESGGVFAFSGDYDRCVISAYRIPNPDYMWILFVQVTVDELIIPKTVFYPVGTVINDALVRRIKNSENHRYLVDASGVFYKPDSEVTSGDWPGPIAVLFTLNSGTLHPSMYIVRYKKPSNQSQWDDDGDLNESWTLPGKLGLFKAVPNETQPIFAMPGDSTVALTTVLPVEFAKRLPLRCKPGSGASSRISMTVTNNTRAALHPCHPISHATVPSSPSTTPPEDVAAGNTGSGGVFTFSTDLCAISAYVSPDPSYIWILFVQASNGQNPVFKTVFYPATKGVDEVLVNDVKYSAAHKDTAKHGFTIAGLDVTYQATCRQAGPLSVEFELTAAAASPYRD